MAGKKCNYQIPQMTIDCESDSSSRDKEISELRQTLKCLSTSPPSPSHMPSKNTLSPGDIIPRRRAASLQIEGRIQHLGEHDYVPEHLVTPLQSRTRIKGPLQRVVNDDMVDMSRLSASKHPSLVTRRCSDPGRVSPALLQARQKYLGTPNPSDGDDDGLDKYPRRPHSPSHFPTNLQVDACYPTSSLHVEGRLSPSLGSPRRRLQQHRHSACVVYPPRAGDESPKMARTSRSHSLPMAVWPDKSPLEVGEAFGALAKNKSSNGDKSGSNLACPQGQQVANIKRVAANRCVSIEEQPLEAIVEEVGTRAQSIRRFSVPHSTSSTAYAHAAMANPVKPLHHKES